MDRTEAIEHLKVVLKTCDVQDEVAVEMAIAALEQTEIIRCKDCKRFKKPSSIIDADWGWCSGWHMPPTVTFVKVDGFCRRAEKRGESE